MNRKGIIRETSDAAPHAVEAPVDEEIDTEKQPVPALAPPEAAAAGPEETQGLRLEREARDFAANWQSRQLGQPLGEEDSRVAAMLKTCETG